MCATANLAISKLYMYKTVCSVKGDIVSCCLKVTYTFFFTFPPVLKQYITVVWNALTWYYGIPLLTLHLIKGCILLFQDVPKCWCSDLPATPSIQRDHSVQLMSSKALYAIGSKVLSSLCRVHKSWTSFVFRLQAWRKMDDDCHNQLEVFNIVNAAKLSTRFMCNTCFPLGHGWIIIRYLQAVSSLFCWFQCKECISTHTHRKK